MTYFKTKREAVKAERLARRRFKLDKSWKTRFGQEHGGTWWCVEFLKGRHLRVMPYFGGGYNRRTMNHKKLTVQGCVLFVCAGQTENGRYGIWAPTVKSALRKVTPKIAKDSNAISSMFKAVQNAL